MVNYSVDQRLLIIIIIITRPKPLYRRQGLAGGIVSLRYRAWRSSGSSLAGSSACTILKNLFCKPWKLTLLGKWGFLLPKGGPKWPSWGKLGYFATNWGYRWSQVVMGGYEWLRETPGSKWSQMLQTNIHRPRWHYIYSSRSPLLWPLQTSHHHLSHDYEGGPNTQPVRPWPIFRNLL